MALRFQNGLSSVSRQGLLDNWYVLEKFVFSYTMAECVMGSGLSPDAIATIVRNFCYGPGLIPDFSAKGELSLTAEKA